MNSQDEGWKFWEQAPDGAKSLHAFLAAEAARDQGEKIFREFVFTLLQAIHERKLSVHELATIREAAKQVPGLDAAQLERDMEKPKMRVRIARDYEEAVSRYGIFGTPTFLWPDGDPVFLKMGPPAPRHEAYSLFVELRNLSQKRPYIREMKKPRRPETAT